MYLFPNRTGSIDSVLYTEWSYRRRRLLLPPEQIGPISDERFIELIRKEEIQTNTEVASPQITKSQWVEAARIPLQALHDRVEQRKAEKLRAERKEKRQRDVAAHNRQLLNRAISAAVADGRVSLNERKQLLDFARAAKIPDSEVDSLLTTESDRFLQSLIEDAIEDGILDEAEKQRISEFATGLGLSLSFTAEQSRRLKACELAAQLANGTFVPNSNSHSDVSLSTNETLLTSVNAEWLEVVQLKKPAGIPLRDNHFLKPVASGECLLTDRRALLVGQFASKKISLTSIESVRRYQDGAFCNRSTGKSVFIRPDRNDVKWDRFSMLLEYAVTKQPVLGLSPRDTFIPDLAIEEVSLTPLPDSEDWQSQFEPRYTFRVVGDHIGSRARCIEQLRIGDQIIVMREPSNPYDSNAVAVFDSAKRQLGYFKREVAAWFGPMLDRGLSFRYQAFRRPSSGGLIVAVFDS